MDENTTDQIIRVQLRKLPKGIRDLIKTIEWETPISQIAKNYSLNPDQVEKLKIETMLVLIGLLHPDEYEQELFNGLGLSQEKVKMIALSMNEKVFKNIRSQIISFLAIEEEDDNPLSKSIKLKMKALSLEKGHLETGPVNTAPTIKTSQDKESIIAQMRAANKIPTPNVAPKPLPIPEVKKIEIKKPEPIVTPLVTPIITPIIKPATPSATPSITPATKPTPAPAQNTTGLTPLPPPKPPVSPIK